MNFYWLILGIKDTVILFWMSTESKLELPHAGNMCGGTEISEIQEGINVGILQADLINDVVQRQAKYNVPNELRDRGAGGVIVTLSSQKHPAYVGGRGEGT